MSDLNQKIAELKTLIGQAEVELLSLQSGKKASAPRVRASLQKIKTLSHSMRSDVMTFTKSLPVNSRVKKTVEPVESLPPPPKLERETTEVQLSPVKPKPKRVRKKTIKEKVVE